MKKLTSLILTICMLSALFAPLSVLPTSAATWGKYTYTVSNGEVTITKCSTSISGSITLPSTLGGYPVKCIGDYAFQNCTKLESVVIGEGVELLAPFAFSGCTGLTSVTIGNSVTSIGEEAFFRCTGLTSVTIPNSVTSIGGSAFFRCTGLTSVTIPDSVTSIGDAAFSGCALLSEINVSSSNSSYASVDGVLFRKDQKRLVCYPGGKKGDSYIIPNSVTSIGGGAFDSCTGLTSVTIGNSVTSIGWKAFFRCTGLTSVTIPDSVTSIGDDAFYGCTGLTSVTIPKSVTSIGEYAFSDCDNLTIYGYAGSYAETYATENGHNFESIGLVLSEKELTYTVENGEATITGCKTTVSGDVTLPSMLGGYPVTSIGDDAFSGCTGLTSVTIGNSVTHIGMYAFSGCTGLTSVTIGNSVTNIEEGTFSGCTGLTSVTIPDSVKSIGHAAFSGCTGLTSVTIGNGVTSIGMYAFSGCTGLTSVTIPDSVTSIGWHAFSGCTGLTSITIPDSVTSIGDWAFEGCALLSEINVSSSNSSYASVDGVLFSKDLKTLVCYPMGKTVASYVIPDSVTSIGDSAFFGCTGLTSVTIPNSVTTIGGSAFDSCTGLTSITIPDSVTSIGDEAFAYCERLTSVTIPNSVTSIGWKAFEGCTGLTSVTIGNSVTSIGWGAFMDTAADFTIYGYAGSVAETYAKENGQNFVDITPPPVPTYTIESSAEGEGSVTATVNGETVTGNEFSVKKGDVVTLMAGEGFKFWKNAKNDTIISTAPTLTVPVTRDMAFVAVFENAVEDETRLVYFKDSRTGKILKRMTVETGYVLQESDFPEAAFKGYKLKGFRVGNVDAVGYVVDHLVEVYTIYQKDLSSSKLLTIYNGGRTSKTQRTFGEVVVVEARAKNFSYWTLDGKIISMDRVYRFNMPDRACDLVAAENKSIPEAVCATVDLSKEGQSFYYLMSRSLSKGNTLLETGVLMTRKATADDLTVDTANNTVTRGYSTADAEYDVVGFVKDATGKTGTWLVRGYITYETADGTIKTVYTDVSSIVIE